MDKTSIYTSYYVVDDGDGDSLDESDMILLTDQETNDYIAQKYFNRKNNLKDILKDKIKKKNEKNDTILHRFGEALGIVPVGVQAETQSKGGKDDNKNPTMLKKTIIVSDRGKRNINVIARYSWTENA